MTYESDNDLLVVHALRLKGFAPADELAEVAGVPVDQVEAALASLAEAELARYREGRVTGWMLTADGRTHGEALLSAELDAAGCREALHACYGGFLECNQDFLVVCTDWQTVEVDGERVPNDHTDADHDSAVIARLAGIDELVQPVCARAGELLARFHGYAERFTAALSKVQAGETDWFTKPVIDSYHTVWFELHENFLASLGIERASEGS